MNNYSEKFEKMRIAGKVASKTLDKIGRASCRERV